MTGGIPVVKMSGAGNDFLVLLPDAVDRLGTGLEAWTRRACRRGVSVGADGVLCLAPAGRDRVRVLFLNPDGSPAFCGNGTRCAARLAHVRGWVGARMVLETSLGEVPAGVDGERVELTLPPPVDRGELTLDVAGGPRAGRHVVAGVPHWVTFVEDPAAAPLGVWGPAVRRHPHFGAEGVNLDVARGGASGSRVVIRTWERGVEGETLACGSGAVAAAFAVRLAGGPSRLQVVPASGIALDVEFIGRGPSPEAVRLAGEARFVFEGEVLAEATGGP
jgi:diaminopimelate epimerase